MQAIQHDPTIPVSDPWASTNLETRASAESGVIGILNGNTPEQSHEGWMQFKIDNGWTFGPVKDEVLKQHPLLVPYNELPESQKLKDHLFSAIVIACTWYPEGEEPDDA